MAAQVTARSVLTNGQRCPWLFVIFLLSAAAINSGCTPAPHWIAASELKASPDPNIQRIELRDGTILTFDTSLGWYDAHAQVIEGIVDDHHAQFSLSEIKSVELAEQAYAFFAFGVVALVAGIGLIVAFIVWIRNSGGL